MITLIFGTLENFIECRVVLEYDFREGKSTFRGIEMDTIILLKSKQIRLINLVPKVCEHIRDLGLFTI